MTTILATLYSFLFLENKTKNADVATRRLKIKPKIERADAGSKAEKSFSTKVNKSYPKEISSKTDNIFKIIDFLKTGAIGGTGTFSGAGGIGGGTGVFKGSFSIEYIMSQD